MKKTLFAIIVFLVAFAIPVTVYSLFVSGDVSSWFAKGEERQEDEIENRSPVIHSLPVTDAYVGEEYVYKVKASDADSDVLQYQLRKSPGWLEWDEELMTVRGMPSLSDVGTHEVEIWVTDGVRVNTQLYQLDVSASSDGNQQNDVQGVSSDRGVGQDNSEAGTPNDDGTVALDRISSPTTTSNMQSRSSSSLAGDESESEVLGAVSQLPDTALFGGNLALGAGAGVFLTGMALWIDGKWNIVKRVSHRMNYERGEQVSMEMDDGVIVKKKQHKA